MTAPLSPSPAPRMKGGRRLALTSISVAFLGALVAVLAALEPAHAAKLPAFMVFAFVVAGKFIVLAPVLEAGTPYDPYYLAGMIAGMDVFTALFVAVNLDLLYRIRWVGRRLEAMEVRGRETLERRPLYRRLATLGVVLFVMFPLTGTGAIGGTIFGRLIGLGTWRIILAIAAGAVLGSFGMAVGADGLARLLAPVRDTAWFRAVGYGVAAVFLGILVWSGLKSGPPPPEGGPEGSSGADRPAP